MDDGGGLRLTMNALDYLILALYFLTVLGVGFAARRAIRTSVDFFLSGRSLMRDLLPNGVLGVR
ncbi:hypothetical protein JNW88_28190 [Micromonospora sp. ATA32]|nr:hypothetical protein [Micromonospora sp. ATA32]